MEGNNTNPTNEAQETIEKVEEVNSSTSVESNQPKVVKTDEGAKDGQNKCPKCGATDISTNINSGKLRCNFCRYEFEPEKIKGMETDISKLSGTVYGSGATDIAADAKDVITFKCSSCGAEVVVDTSNQMTARCHWCRNTLSVNQQIPNGAVPDVVLPFGVKKDDARASIEKFVGKRKFFAHPQFKKEFTTANIMGVYFPYMLVDINAHASLKGEGEHQIRSYVVKNGDSTTTYYDADLYRVERDYDITIEGLSIESNSDRLDTNSKEKTNNIINSIMPFDVENCVKYNANYLKGYTSEKRDTNIDQIKPIVEVQAKDVSRYAANESLKFYDRGVKWNSEQLDVKGEQWKSAYLPVWLYSYQEVKKDKKLLHYVAVNARTKETMGSVPIHMPKLFAISFIVEIIGLLVMLFPLNFGEDPELWKLTCLLAGPIYYWWVFSKYRNSGARHTYEKETKTNLNNMSKVDDFLEHRKRLSSSSMVGANNKQINGANKNKKLMAGINLANIAVDNIPAGSFLRDKIEKAGEEKKK